MSKNSIKLDINPSFHQTQLSRDLSLFQVTMIGVGAMIGAGIFVLTGIAAAISEAYKSNINVTMIVPPGISFEERNIYQQRVDDSIALIKGKVKNVEGELVKAKSISSGILKMTETYDVCILGAAREGLMQQLIFGSIPEIVAKKCRHTVIMVKKYQGAKLKNIINLLFRKAKERVGKR